MPSYILALTEEFRACLNFFFLKWFKVKHQGVWHKNTGSGLECIFVINLVGKHAC